jgi:hypothetical protein
LKTHLNGFLNDVIDNEQGEETFTGQDEEIHVGHITQQFDSPKCKGRQGTTSGRELSQDPAKKKGYQSRLQSFIINRHRPS